MRRTLIAAPLIIGALIVPSTARAQTGDVRVQGFGGLTLRGFTNSTTFGGTVAVPLTNHIQIIGEGGRMTDIMSSTLATLLDFTPVEMRLSAYYGEGGVRLIGGHGSGVRPYAEATAGFARMHVGFAGAGSRQDAIINAGLQFLDRTEPMLGLGGGVILEGGPVVVDFGYRYKKIRAGNVVQSVLTGGDFGVNQLRVGIGFKF
jgi:opacity protein-like surface antigen